jgi:hypothetical protein
VTEPLGVVGAAGGFGAGVGATSFVLPLSLDFAAFSGTGGVPAGAADAEASAACFAAGAL